DLRREAMLEATSFATQRLLGMERWREEIDDVLAKLGDAAGASRAYVFENGTDQRDRLTAWERFEGTAPGIEPVIHEPGRQGGSWAEAGFAAWAEILGAGGELVGPIDELLPEPGMAFQPDVRSMAVVPLVAGG